MNFQTRAVGSGGEGQEGPSDTSSSPGPQHTGTRTIRPREQVINLLCRQMCKPSLLQVPRWCARGSLNPGSSRTDFRRCPP